MDGQRLLNVSGRTKPLPLFIREWQRSPMVTDQQHHLGPIVIRSTHDPRRRKDIRHSSRPKSRFASPNWRWSRSRHHKAVVCCSDIACPNTAAGVKRDAVIHTNPLYFASARQKKPQEMPKMPWYTQCSDGCRDLQTESGSAASASNE